MEITVDDHRDKKWQNHSFWQSLAASSSEKLQSRSDIHSQLNGVVTFNGRSSSSLFSAARLRILRLDPSDHRYFPHQPLKQKTSAVEDKDSEELQTFARVTKREGDLLLFSGPLFIINSLLSKSLCKLFACRPDAESHISRFVAWGNDMLEGFKCYYNPISPREIAYTEEQEKAFRQLVAILNIYILAMFSRDLDALKAIARLPFLSVVDLSCPDFTAIHIQKISLEVEACLPSLLNYALYCLDDVADIDGSVGPIKAKIALFLYCNLNRHWARDLYARMA